MLYSYGSFLSKITISLTCMMMPIPYIYKSIKKERIASCLRYTLSLNKRVLNKKYL